MEQHGSGRLKDMMLAARFVDNSVDDISKVLLSIDGLMPDEANKEQALQMANQIFLEVKELEDKINCLKDNVRSLLNASIQENETADSAIKSMTAGIAQIEETLKNYGYNASMRPTEIPEILENEPLESTGSEDDDSLATIEDDNMSSTPQALLEKEVSMINESLTGVEITPMVLSSKSLPRSSGITGSPVLTPCSKGFTIPAKELSPSNNVYCAGPYLYSPSSPAPVVKTELSVKPLKVLEQPARPILSLSTYEILGVEPPPEFYAGAETT